jgi:hypothetical protein
MHQGNATPGLLGEKQLDWLKLVPDRSQIGYHIGCNLLRDCLSASTNPRNEPNGMCQLTNRTDAERQASAERSPLLPRQPRHLHAESDFLSGRLNLGVMTNWISDATPSVQYGTPNAQVEATATTSYDEH